MLNTLNTDSTVCRDACRSAQSTNGRAGDPPLRAREPLLWELQPAGARLSPLPPMAAFIPRLILQRGVERASHRPGGSLGNPTRARNLTHTFNDKFPSTGVGTRRVSITMGSLLHAREVRVRVPVIIITIQSTTAAPIDRDQTRQVVTPGLARKNRAMGPLQPDPGQRVIVAVAPRNATPATPAGRVSEAANLSLRTVFR